MQESCIPSDYEIPMVATMNLCSQDFLLSFPLWASRIQFTAIKHTIYEVTKLYIVVIKTDMEV